MPMMKLLISDQAALPAWDLYVSCGGVRYPVREPTSDQISRISDLVKATGKEAWDGLVQMFSELTGLTYAAAKKCDRQELYAFYGLLAKLMIARMDAKRRLSSPAKTFLN